jgi:hypothetical protein
VFRPTLESGVKKGNLLHARAEMQHRGGAPLTLQQPNAELHDRVTDIGLVSPNTRG